MAKGDRLYNQALKEALKEPANDAKAKVLLEKAEAMGNFKANGNVASAAFDLAICYEKGNWNGVK